MLENSFNGCEKKFYDASESRLNDSIEGADKF
jgi:hypothetical protein